MTDIASLGISIDTRQVNDASKALDGLGDASIRVEQKTNKLNGQMNDTAKILQYQADQARAAAAANAVLGNSTSQLTIGQQLFIDKLRDQVAVLGITWTLGRNVALIAFAPA